MILQLHYLAASLTNHVVRWRGSAEEQRCRIVGAMRSSTLAATRREGGGRWDRSASDGIAEQVDGGGTGALAAERASDGHFSFRPARETWLGPCSSLAQSVLRVWVGYGIAGC
jgi:hypothetical protein